VRDGNFMTSPAMLPVAIVIPTWNRAELARQAVLAALEQTHHETIVIVVDDGSTDETQAMLAPFTGDPRLSIVRLAQNRGTAVAKNVGLMLAGARAVTYHDSDDLPHPDKVARQAHAMARSDIVAEPGLNWAAIGRQAEAPLQVGAVLCHHDLVLRSGRVVQIRRSLSLADDLLPNLQLGAQLPGDWTHVNSGLFHSAVFERLGGFADSIEEDRDFRNRLILSGEIVLVLDDVLLTKIETADALTQAPATNYASPRRAADRARAWARVADWREGRALAPEPVDLPDLEIAAITRPENLRLSATPATSATRARLERALQAAGGPAVAA
jgi:glycosyltransferase involved in cell wall biosynthesis